MKLREMITRLQEIEDSLKTCEYKEHHAIVYLQGDYDLDNVEFTVGWAGDRVVIVPEAPPY